MAAAAAPAPIDAREALPPTHSLDAIAERTMNVLALNPITGTPAEKLAQWKDFAANMSESLIAINGWTTAAQYRTACWMADGQGVHPSAFVNGHWLFQVRGNRNVVEPKFEYVVGLMRARIPGFRMKVVEKSGDRAVVWMTNGVDEHTETYTKEYATKQGLFGKDTYTQNDQDQLFKQCVKRCADVIGSHVTMGLPDLADQREFESTTKPTPVGSPSLPAAAVPAAPLNEVALLGDFIGRIYKIPSGKANVGAKLAKAALVMTEMRGAKVEYTKADQLAPSDAKEIREFLEKKYDENGNPRAGANGAPAAESSGGGQQPTEAKAAGTDAPAAAPTREPGDDDEIPPSMYDNDAPPAEEEQAPDSMAADLAELDGKLATLREVAKSAQKSHPGVTFIKESPAGSGVWWFVYKPVNDALGQSDSPKLEKAGAQTVSADLCRALVREMRKIGGVTGGGEAPARHANRVAS